MAISLLRKRCFAPCLVSLLLGSDWQVRAADLLVENPSEFTAIELKDSKDRLLATLDIKTGWTQTGLMYAKEYTLDLVMTATTTTALRSNRTFYFYISIPFKKPESPTTLTETIRVQFRAGTDTRVQFYQTGDTLVAPGNKPNFSTAVVEQELLQ